MKAGRFGNIKDDNQRLNDHTQAVLQELGDLSAIWSGKYDGRAIYIALQTFSNFYYFQGAKSLGTAYMGECNEQSFKLAQELNKRPT